MEKNRRIFVLPKTLWRGKAEKMKKAAIRFILGSPAVLFFAGRADGERAMLLFLFLWVVAEAAFEDHRFGKVPDGYMCTIFVIGFAAALPQAPESFFIGMAGTLLLTLPFFAAALLRPGAFGGADIKLAAACGFCLGPSLSFSCLVWTFLFAGAGSLWRLMHQANRSDRFPFLPYLAAGIIFGLLLR